MAVDPRKRQKKLEKKASKEKAKRRELVASKNRGFVERIHHSGSCPWVDCLHHESAGLHTVWMGRRLQDGTIAMAVALVDAMCLGLKDVIARVVDAGSYAEQLSKMRDRQSLRPLSPADARVLIEGAMGFARRLQFPPHADQRKILAMLFDTEPASATRAWTFGTEDGKPLYVSGVESVERARQILYHLHEVCGEGGFNYVVNGTSPAAEILSEITARFPQGSIE